MNIKQNIFELGKEIQLANLATITEGGKPWVRYVLGMLDKELNFRVSVQLSSRKVKQIKKNPHVHVTMGVTDISKVNQWVQIQGVADISTDKSERHAFWNDSLKNIFSGPNDPNYAVIIVRPSKIELEKIGESSPEVWTQDNQT